MLTIVRYHIMLVAMAACVTFGWIITGKYNFALILVVAVDWFLINFINRITDIDEDSRNHIQGTDLVARKKNLFWIISIVTFIVSFVATHAMYPQTTLFRVFVQMIGFGYNFRIVPTLKGLSRFKEIYFLKNFMSAVIFVFTCFVYPIAANHYETIVSIKTILILVLFFVPFELSYEILYDLRDLEGDRALSIPTYPVVHGAGVSFKIIDGLLIWSVGVLVAGFFMRFIGVRELLMVFAPIHQFWFYKSKIAHGLTSHDCIVLTHLGTAQLILFLIGTALWNKFGLPVNVYW